MSSLLLDTDQWDLVLDANGNIALADAPYALAHDVSCAVRTVLGECYYNTSIGLDYFGQVYGKTPPVSLIIQLIVAQVLTVPGVITAQCVISSFSARSVSGQIQFTDDTGEPTVVNF